MSKAGTEAIRHQEILYLQEQNRLVLSSLERVEAEREEAQELIRACEEKDLALNSELETVKSKIAALVDRLGQDKNETVAKEEHVKVLSEQNKQMLSLLEMEENKSKEKGEHITDLEKKNRKLNKIAQEFDAAKARIEKEVAEAKAKCAEIVAQVRGQRALNETLRASIQNTEAKTRVDIEALAQALQVVDHKNLEYMTRINKQETREQQLTAETEALKEEVENVRMEIDKLRKQLEGDAEGRTKFERARGQMEMAIQALEVQADTLKKALSTAERANEQLQQENRAAAERSRETADKVYALMDSLRLNQVELKKQEAENHAREKKMISLERTIQNLQARISMETDAKVLAEQERKEAEQEAILLKKKNKKLEEGVTASQAAQDKAEKEIHEMNEKVSNLQTQNAYLASRIDGQEEEKSSLRAEMKKVSDRTTDLVGENGRLRDNIDQLEEEAAVMINDKQQLVKELEYIKREDLDEAGRQRPILIQSSESDLLEKLQVNEFLFEAQQARNPVPPLIEKIAQLLAMLHDGQTRADQYLGDLSKSNALVSALRQRNMSLFSRTQMFESFKTRALLRYVMNLIEDELITDLHLDSLSFGPREITEMVSLMQRYEATDKVFVVSLQDNSLDDDSINLLLQLVYALPYLRSLDLRKNAISHDGIKRLEDQLKLIEGVTTVIRTANQVINVHSGNQLRLTVDCADQMTKEMLAKEIDFTVHRELQHTDADPFLDTEGGKSSHPWTKSSTAKEMRSHVPAGAAGAPTAAAAGGGGGGGGGAGGAAGGAAPQQAVPDASTVEVKKMPPNAPVAPVLGGPPVGLGGPGNVAALNKKPPKATKDAPPDAKRRQSRRAKGAPPAPLTDHYGEMDVRRSASAAALLPPGLPGLAQQQRPGSSTGSRRSIQERSPSVRRAADFGASTGYGALGERAISMPVLPGKTQPRSRSLRRA